MLDSPSLFLQWMARVHLPIAVAHGEDFANFARCGNAAKAIAVMRFTAYLGQPTKAYPANPNGSPGSFTAVTAGNGRWAIHSDNAAP